MAHGFSRGEFKFKLAIESPRLKRWATHLSMMRRTSYQNALVVVAQALTEVVGPGDAALLAAELATASFLQVGRLDLQE
ncbi:MAG: hypothetical protein DHS20C16_20040 [Phycisphaerae bacterium]|nr:MAG: hypothetical protein DHS20C16_20040 [Phycisphaerae bacterium]